MVNVKVRQIQAPVEIGLSTNLMSRMGAHQPSTNFTNATCTYAVTFACATARKIKLVSVCFPLIKVWKASQLSKAEIACTMLSGSLVYDYGFNIQQASTETYKNFQHDFISERNEVFVEKPWFQDNLKHGVKAIASREQSLQTVQQMDQKVLENKIAEGQFSLETITSSVNSLIVKRPALLEKTKSRIEILRERIILVRAHQAKLQQEIKMCTRLKEAITAQAG